MKHSFIVSILSLLLFLGSSCGPTKETASKEILDLGYMYWANDFTPFGFGSRYTLIILGTVSEIHPPAISSEDALYTSVEGRIAIQEVIYDSKSHNKDISQISHITSDCFDGTGFKKGDQILVFCVSYEGNYAITGKQSLIKIPMNDRRYITSLKKYIDASYDPTVIESDIDLWDNVVLGNTLKNYIKEYRDYKNN